MFIDQPGQSSDRDEMYNEDVADFGFVMNLTRAWAWIPGINQGLFQLLDEAAASGGLSYRDKGVLITALASTMGDSYCTLAWGTRLADVTSPDTAVAVITGQAFTGKTAGELAAEALSEREMALAGWARKVAADPNSTTQADVDALRGAGLSDGQISAATAYVALRIAFSTFNDAIGAAPDLQKAEEAPVELVRAIVFGRPTATTPSPVL